MPSRRLQGLVLWLSAVLPYLIFASLAGTLQRNAIEVLAFLTGVLTFWHLLLPEARGLRCWLPAGRRRADGPASFSPALCCARSAPANRRAGSPDVDPAGHCCAVGLSRVGPGRVWLMAESAEWRVGFACYAAALIPLAILAVPLHDLQFAPMRGEWWQVAGLGIATFFGVLWVLALGEELFFRGVIERALLTEWRSRWLAILLIRTLVRERASLVPSFSKLAARTGSHGTGNCLRHRVRANRWYKGADGNARACCDNRQASV